MRTLWYGRGTGKKNRLAQWNTTAACAKEGEGKCDHKAATAVWEVKRAEWRSF